MAPRRLPTGMCTKGHMGTCLSAVRAKFRLIPPSLVSRTPPSALGLGSTPDWAPDLPTAPGCGDSQPRGGEPGPTGSWENQLPRAQSSTASRAPRGGQRCAPEPPQARPTVKHGQGPRGGGAGPLGDSSGARGRQGRKLDPRQLTGRLFKIVPPLSLWS